MKTVVKFLQDYLIRGVSDNDVPADQITMPDGASLCETGPDIIAKVTSLIALRRPVLLTGSRGCGKSYCALRGALLAEQENIIGGNRFLQGNRELPREYLNEDGLVIDSGKPVTIPALAMTPIDAKPGFTNIYSVPKPKEYVAWLEQQKLNPDDFPWPAMPSSIVDPHLDGDGKMDPRGRFWSPKDWWVLFLDEVNRFGDGFLDGLLSLAEEGKIVRRGQSFYVPVVLVCTANPPGYDITAKRLSPPLQSRIAACYRIGQPSLEVLDSRILEDRLRQIRAKYPDVVITCDPSAQSNSSPRQLKIFVPRETRALACAYLLSLWCDPGVVSRPQGKVTKGVFYLLPKTRWDQHELCTVATAFSRQKRTLFNALDELGALAEYGPDARAIGDWFALVVQNLITRFRSNPPSEPVELTMKHLRDECIAVLGKKIRENYNEAADPDKDQAKDKLLLEIFDFVFSGPAKEEICKLVYRNKLALLEASAARGNSKEMQAHLCDADPRWRSRLIDASLNLLSKSDKAEIDWDEWRTFCSRSGPLSGVMYDGCFRTPQVRHWIARSVALAYKDDSLARRIMLLPCLNNQTNLLLFAAAAKGDSIALAEVTSFRSPKTGTALSDKQTKAIVARIQQIHESSNLPRWKKTPERSLALALGFIDRLTATSTDPDDNTIVKAVHWYLGWFLEEAVPGATPDKDLIQPLSSARSAKPVLSEALQVADGVLDALSEDEATLLIKDAEKVGHHIRQRCSDLKHKLPGARKAANLGSSAGPNSVRAADIVLSGQSDDANIDAARAGARRQEFPFNLAGFPC